MTTPAPELNLPIWDRLAASTQILIAGIGGGFDLFCALPIYFTLRQRGYTVHLANYSFAEVQSFSGGVRLSDTLVGVRAGDHKLVVYFPELHLAQWLVTVEPDPLPIWCFHKTGVRPLAENYRLLIDHLAIDTLLLIDGGIDSLAHGDEAMPGTFVEDSVSLAAVQTLTDVPTRLLLCSGFGAEQEVTHLHFFENMATLAKAGAFLGACALTPAMLAYQQYEQAVLAVHGQPFQDPSVINASIISAVRGEYGNYHLTEKTQGSRLWISPLMTLYWFYAFEAVSERNLVLDALAPTDTFPEAIRAALGVRQGLRQRRGGNVPL
jgi:hypothetical protein